MIKIIINSKIMKAKQLFRFAMVAMFAVAMSSAFVSCDKTDEPQNPDTPVVPQVGAPAAACMDLTFKSTAEMRQFFTMTLEYYNEKGEVVSEVIDKDQVVKKVKSESLPAKAGYRVLIAEKEGLDRSAFTQFKVNYGYECFIYTVDKDGKKVKDIAGPANDFINALAINKIDGWLNGYKAGLLKTLYEVDANGGAKAIDW